MHWFRRGKLADFVEESYGKLEADINQYNFLQFVMAIKGAGYISSKLLNSRMTLDFAYTLYLMLLDDNTIPNAQIKRYLQKWFVLSTLTSRYIGLPETLMERKNNIAENVLGNLIMERMGKCPAQVECFLNRAGNNISV